LIGGKRPSDSYPVIVEHMKRVREVPGCKNATIVVVPESNLGYESSNIGDFIKAALGEERPGNYVTMKEDDLRVGVKTNEAFKWAMTVSLDLCLQLRAIRFHREMFSLGDRIPISPIDVPDENDRFLQQPPLTPVQRFEMADRARETLIEQMQTWTRTIKPRKDPTDPRPPAIQVNGKIGGKPDDMCLALMLANTMHKRFYSNSLYRDYRPPTAFTLRSA
jgi:hypothetical protein